jgi:Uma2 family endonuclease
MYERFTDRAIKVMQLACEEAQSLNHEYIGTEHILLGLIKEDAGVAANVLKNLGMDLRKIRLEVEGIVQVGPTKVLGKLPQTPRAKYAIKYAIEEAKDLKHNYVGTEHLLLGLLRDKEGVASQVLMNLGLKLSDVHYEVLQILGCDVPAESGPTSDEPIRRGWTREEYYCMGDLGFFQGQRVELIEGEIMVLSPQKAEHWTTTDRVAELLRVSFGSGYHVRMQGPIDFGQVSEPEPDIAVVAGSRAQYATHHPTTAVLIVEIAESRLNYDRTRKASLYARAGIADYWIVNLVDKQLEVRRDPRPDPSQPYGHGYASVTILVPPAVVNPLAAPQVSLAVADLLP